MIKKLSPSLLIKTLWILVGLVSLGQLQRIEIGNSIAFYLHDLFVSIWVFIIFATNLEHFRKLGKTLIAFIKKDLRLKLIFFTIGWGILLTILGSLSQGTITPILYLLRLVIYCLFAVSLTIFSSKKTQKLRQQHIVTALIIAIIGILQFLFLPDTRFLYIFGWDDHYYRLISTLFDPAFTGAFLMLGLFFFLEFIKNENNKLSKLVTLILLSAIFLTFSRATIISTLLGLLILGRHGLIKLKIRKPQIVAILLIFLLTPLSIYWLVGGEGARLWRVSTVKARLDNITSATKQISPKQILIGTGFYTYSPTGSTNSTSGNIARPNHAKVPDNSLVMLIYSIGLPATVLFAGSLITYLSRNLKQHSLIIASLVALLIHAQFNNTILQPFIWLYFWWGTVLYFEKKALRPK